MSVKSGPVTAWTKVQQLGDMVMFRHTLFAFPFAVTGAFMAAGGLPDLGRLFWICAAVLGARNGANALNRIIDRDIDALNPRTCHRHLPQGLIKYFEAAVFTLACFAVLVLAAYKLDPIYVVLLPIPMLIFFIYSYTKRFTWLCHLVLGAAVAGAPVGAWIAITNTIGIAALLLGAAVALWVAGFDVIYGTLDVEFDRKTGLFSIPAAFGIPKALKISSAMHIFSVVLLYMLRWFVPLGNVYLVGLLIVAGLLLYEHVIVTPDNLGQVKIAAYNVNEIVSPILMVFTVLDLLT